MSGDSKPDETWTAAEAHGGDGRPSSLALLEAELKVLLVEALMLEGVDPAEIESEAPLFGDGLGLDSIDALELAMALHKRYGVRTKADEAKNREIFASVRNLAAFVADARASSPLAPTTGS